MPKSRFSAQIDLVRGDFEEKTKP
uniref:Uncharacterized protein n=1 Tax=Arundo donax TaxID=35708 RepID=A0A0A9GMM5_ARUDO